MGFQYTMGKESWLASMRVAISGISSVCGVCIPAMVCLRGENSKEEKQIGAPYSVKAAFRYPPTGKTLINTSGRQYRTPNFLIEENMSVSQVIKHEDIVVVGGVEVEGL